MPGKIAIVGATGAVGRCFVSELLKYVAPENLLLIASSNSAGKEITVDGYKFLVQALSDNSFLGVNIVFFSAGARISLEYAPKALVAGAWVIDNSSAFRSHMPLVVPEINHSIVEKRGIVSNPNCAVIPLALSFNAFKSQGLKSASVVTLQSVSGSGSKGVQALLDGLDQSLYPAPIHENVIPLIDDITENGFTKEEMKLHNEVARIMDSPIPVVATTIRVPVLRGHSMAVHLTAEKPWVLDDVYEMIAAHPSIVLVPDLEPLTPRTHVSSCPGAFVSRVRVDHSNPNNLVYWLVSDNLLKGAALNAVQIAQSLGLLREGAGVRT